jgi:hypothetical protein
MYIMDLWESFLYEIQLEEELIREWEEEERCERYEKVYQLEIAKLS